MTSARLVFSPSKIEIPQPVEAPIRAWLESSSFKHQITDNIVKFVWCEIVQLMKSARRRKNKPMFVVAVWAKKFSRYYNVLLDLIVSRTKHWSKDEGKCKLIESWSEGFKELAIKCLKACKDSKVGFKFPGANCDEYFTSAKSNRYYHWLQNLSKAQKRELMKGKVDLDAKAMFPNIFLRHLVKGRKLHPAFLQMVRDPKAFLARIEREGVWTFEMKVGDEEKSAKAMRSRLFASLTVPRIGVAWYDDLMLWIRRVFVEEGVSNPHLFFTGKERELMVEAIRLIGEDRIVLLMHDGLIVDWEGDVDELVAMLSAHTDYEWCGERF